VLPVTSFFPFIALRYRRSPDLDALVAPPYDVISDAQRLALEDGHPANAVRIDFPRDEVQPKPDGLDRYTRVARRLGTWLAGGVLSKEFDPTLTIYRMTATDSAGRVTVTTGVMGALGLEPPGTGDVLPHEQTTHKDKADRLSLLQATRVNTSPIWGLSMTPGLHLLYQPAGPAHHRAVDADGVIHESWILTDPDRIKAICESIEKSPVVVADGHHRFETALTYQAERDATDVGATSILALIVELAPDQLDVRAIHRIIHTCADDLAGVVSRFCDLNPIDPALIDDQLANELSARGSFALETIDGAWLATPRLDAFPDDITLDSERVAYLLSTVEHAVSFHHDIATLRAAVAEGAAGALVLRPATVEQIRHVAETRTRMPAKTTFFWPKPRSGMVFRSLD
jgi:uncharacterized protein (DUF1015 family)